jgi:hypothetical protein
MSDRFTLNKQDFKDAVINALWFTAPVILIYLYSILDVLQQPEYVFSFDAFIPSNATVIAMIVWLLNRAVDVFRRYVGGVK